MRARWTGLVVLCIVSCARFSGEDSASDAGGAGDAGLGATDSGPVIACRDRPMTEWQVPRRLTELVGSKGELYFADPFVSADGSTLLLAHADGDTRVVYRSTRASAGAPWSAPSRLVGFTNPSYSPPFPSAAKPDEVIVAIPYGGAGLDIGALVPDAGSWSVLHFDELQRPDNDLFPTVTADGTTLIFAEFGASAANPFRTLFQATRSTPSPSSPWGDKHDLHTALADGGPSLPPDIDAPAATPDGLALFYADEAAERVHYVSRRARSEPFFSASSAPITIASLAVPGSKTRVRSITADGCELYLTSDRDGVEDVYVALRGP